MDGVHCCRICAVWVLARPPLRSGPNPELHVTTYARIQRQQLIQEVEGYLDLAMVLSDRYPLSSETRDRIVQRALNTLDRLEPETRESAVGLHLLGQALRVTERYEEAIVPLTAAKDSDPENIHILLSLGWCYKRIDRIEAAIQVLEDALAVSPEEAIILYNLACYWSLANNVPLALFYLSRAFDIEPDYRDMVAEEPDFDPMRDHPEFLAIMDVIV